jgi:DNA-binding CsgD family transcriptional regulator
MELTPREREVARLIAGGHSSKQIAAELGISFRTVVSHRFRIFQKLGVTNTAELVAQAVLMGLVDFFADRSTRSNAGQALSDRIIRMSEENTRERELLTALIAESRLLREQSAASRKDLHEVRHQVIAQIEKLMECMNDGSRRNPQTAPDVREDSSGIHLAGAEYVHAARRNGSVSAAD